MLNKKHFSSFLKGFSVAENFLRPESALLRKRNIDLKIMFLQLIQKECFMLKENVKHQ